MNDIYGPNLQGGYGHMVNLGIGSKEVMIEWEIIE